MSKTLQISKIAMCGVCLIFSIATVFAAYAEITAPQQNEYVNDEEISIEGIAIADEGSTFTKWVLELGAFDQGIFNPTRTLTSSTEQKRGSVDEEELIEEDEERLIRGVPLYTLDLSSLPIGEHALRLTAIDTKGVDTFTAAFYKTQSIKLNLRHHLNKEFYQVIIFFYGEIITFFTVESDPLYAKVLGNGNPDPEQGPITDCLSACDLTIDLFSIEEKAQEEGDIQVIAEDTDGTFYSFYKKFDARNGIKEFTFDISTTREIKAIERAKARLPSSAEYVLAYSPEYPFYFMPTDETDSLKIQVDTREENNLRYNDYELTIRFDLIQGENIVYAEVPLFYPFEESQEEKDFIRGDVDGSGRVDISDAIFILNYLFAGGASPRCEDAADANDDGKIEIADAINILSFLFTGGKPLPPPDINTPAGFRFDTTSDKWVCIKES